MGAIGGEEGVELDAAKATGFPVLAGGGDLAGVDGADDGVEVVEELTGDGCWRDVGNPHRRPAGQGHGGFLRAFSVLVTEVDYMIILLSGLLLLLLLYY